MPSNMLHDLAVKIMDGSRPSDGRPSSRRPRDMRPSDGLVVVVVVVG